MTRKTVGLQAEPSKESGEENALFEHGRLRDEYAMFHLSGCGKGMACERQASLVFKYSYRVRTSLHDQGTGRYLASKVLGT